MQSPWKSRQRNQRRRLRPTTTESRCRMTIFLSDAAVQTEKALLRSVLLTNSLWPQTSRVAADDFFLDSDRRIYPRIGAMIEDERPLDLVTVTTELAQLNQFGRCGEPARLGSLIDHPVAA